MSKTDSPGRTPIQRGLGWLGVVVAAALLLFVGARVGQALFAPGPAASFATELQEVRTTDGNFVGRVVSDDDDYIRLADPAVVTPLEVDGGTGEGQVAVQRLATEPFGLVGDLLINREQVIFVGGVANDSQLARAYAEASGATPSPAGAPTP